VQGGAHSAKHAPMTHMRGGNEPPELSDQSDHDGSQVHGSNRATRASCTGCKVSHGSHGYHWCVCSSCLESRLLRATQKRGHSELMLHQAHIIVCIAPLRRGLGLGPPCQHSRRVNVVSCDGSQVRWRSEPQVHGLQLASVDASISHGCNRFCSQR
jgi:hypothetical protein